MALAQEKKGGPYTKDERDKRQKEVHRLYIELGYPAVKIAEVLDVHRNTISEDIKFLYSNLKEELKEGSENLILRQIGRLEAQRTRNIENIIENKIDDIKHEKLLLDIDKELDRISVKINSGKQVESKSFEIQEEVIKDIVLFLIIKHASDYYLRKEDIISEIINLQQCTKIEAESIFVKIEELGLECCRKFRSSEFVYDLLEFAYLRKYLLPNDKFVVKINSLYILEKQLEYDKNGLRKRYSEKYGNKKKWADEIFEKYDEDKTKVIKKHAEISSKIIAESLDELSNQEKIKEYIKCMSIFFGKKIEDRFEEL